MSWPFSLPFPKLFQVLDHTLLTAPLLKILDTASSSIISYLKASKGNRIASRVNPISFLSSCSQIEMIAAFLLYFRHPFSFTQASDTSFTDFLSTSTALFKFCISASVILLIGSMILSISGYLSRIFFRTTGTGL